MTAAAAAAAAASFPCLVEAEQCASLSQKQSHALPSLEAIQRTLLLLPIQMPQPLLQLRPRRLRLQPSMFLLLDRLQTMPVLRALLP